MEFFKKRGTAWAFLTVVIIFSFFIGQARQPADKIEILPSGVYVQDNANILSDDTEEYMTQLNNGLVSKLGAEIQVGTINTTGGQDIFSTAIDVGVKTNLSANSCVFLVAVDDIDAVIVQGEDLIYAFSDNELTYILQSNYSEKEFKDRNLDKPTRDSFTDLISMYEDYYNVVINGSVGIEHIEKNNSGDATAIIIFLIVILLLILIVSSPRRRRTVPTYTGGSTVYTPRGNYPPRGTYTTPPRRSNNSSSWSGGSSRTGGFGGSSRGGSFSSSSRPSSSSRSSFGGSSRSGGFGSSSRGGSFRSGSGSSRGGGFRKR